MLATHLNMGLPKRRGSSWTESVIWKERKMIMIMMMDFIIRCREIAFREERKKNY